MYLKRIDKSELYEKKGENRIVFIFNGCAIRFGDQTPVEEFFKGISNPKILVNDVDNLIGG